MTQAARTASRVKSWQGLERLLRLECRSWQRAPWASSQGAEGSFFLLAQGNLLVQIDLYSQAPAAARNTRDRKGRSQRNREGFGKSRTLRGLSPPTGTLMSRMVLLWQDPIEYPSVVLLLSQVPS